VKRKIDRMPVTDHLMPVILGAQGTGKSTLIRQMLKPINELWVPSDFKQITDDRNTMLWKNYAIFLDEMGWASKSDMDTVKNIITADTLNRRIMQTTKYNVVAQNATFIGAANANELADLIRDVSGTRRFVSLNMKTQADWQLINAIDWQEVWQSVDHAACDPMAGFRGVLGAVQEADRTKTPVESWLDSLNPKTSLTGFKPSTLIGFGREMKRRCADETGRFIRSEKDNMAVFQWRDSKLTKIAPNLRLVTGTDD
jgi:predicted kinase